jgi:hypothetical protein
LNGEILENSSQVIDGLNVRYQHNGLRTRITSHVKLYTDQRIRSVTFSKGPLRNLDTNSFHSGYRINCRF